MKKKIVDDDDDNNEAIYDEWMNESSYFGSKFKH